MAIKGLVYFFYSPFQGMIYWLYRLLSAGKGADMNYYNASGQMDLSDRIAIETGICIGESFKKIAKDFADIHLLLHMKLKKTEPSLKVITRMEKIAAWQDNAQ